MAALGDRLPVMAACPLIALKDSRGRANKVISTAARVLAYQVNSLFYPQVSQKVHVDLT